MLQVVGNLSERGMAFFLDRGLKYEIVQNSEIEIDSSGSYEFFIGIRHRYEGDKRYGKILALEENYLSFLVDMVEEVQGEQFRNYDNIANIEFEVEFDAYAFIKNLLIGLLDKQFYHVLEFISLPHMNNKEKCFHSCSCEPSRRTFVNCLGANCGEMIPIWRYKPNGWWGQEEYPPSGYYNFFTDYFYEPGGELDRISLFDQWFYNTDITRMLTNKYLDSGYKSYSNSSVTVRKSFNYINNIYPEQSEIMDYRWKYGGYDVTWLEYRLKKTYIYRTFQSWYVGELTDSIHNKDLVFVADEMTVKGHTDIAKTDTRRIFERDEHILEELLGPKHCIAWDEHGECTRFAYGDFIPEESEYSALWQSILEDDSEEKIWPAGEVPEHTFIVKHNRSFEALSEPYINSESYKSICSENKGIHPSDAFYAIEHSDGKIGGQYVFNNGLGNEHRYFMKFREFLAEQDWTLDDFMGIYSGQIADRVEEIKKAIVSPSTARIKDFSEFYDKNHKAPFDGIEYYIPMIPAFDPLSADDAGIEISKRRVEIDQNGAETIVDSGTESVNSGDFTASIDKDEFISNVSIRNSLRIFVSDYMRIRVKITLNDLYPTTNVVKMRVSASDFTYLNIREFEYYE